MKKNIILIIGSITVVILTMLWFFKVVDEPFVAIFGAILTSLGYILSKDENTTQFTKNTLNSDNNQDIKIAICKSNDFDFVFSNKEIFHTSVTLTYFSFQKPDGIESYLSIHHIDATLANNFKKSIINDPVLERELKYCEELSKYDVVFIVYDARSIVPELNISILNVVRYFSESFICVLLYDKQENLNAWNYRLKAESAKIIEVNKNDIDTIWTVFASKYINLIPFSKKKFFLDSLNLKKS